ncbi:PqqD family peptide modification chaperone [Desulfobacula sp.]|uniref:PqqD family peptide modification chaperone n=1 Tax=Desulfobacula sp. TaxID=2593537 RepID=UPI00261DEEE8|nr:PqqD family peptide modification chaperone [Desulfobacula sp.]
MAIFKKKPDLDKKDALLCIPEKNSLVEETYLDSGDLILSYPALYKPFFMNIQKIIRRNPQATFLRKIQLDRLGIDVWLLLDGKKNVKTLIKEFAVLHTLNYKEAEISVTLFLRSLGEKGVIGIKEP